MRLFTRAALFILALTAGCQTVRYDSERGHFVADPETYQPPAKRR